MIKLDLAELFTLIVLTLVAGFGYYRGFMALITRRTDLSETRSLKGIQALGIAVLYLAGAIIVSGVAVLLYFSN